MKKEIPTHDPQTGERNPYYEELTKMKNPLFCEEYSKISEGMAGTNKDLDKMPNQKWHQIISFIKSGIRIIGYIIIPFDLVIAASVLVFSEIIGILEELV